MINAIRRLVCDAKRIDPADHMTWPEFTRVTPGKVVDLYHVTAAANLHDIAKEGLVPNAAPMGEDTPAKAVYFTDHPPIAKTIAGKIGQITPPAIIHLKVSVRDLMRQDPRVDPEEEYGGRSIAFVPDPKFVRNHLASVITDDHAAVPKQWAARVAPIAGSDWDEAKHPRDEQGRFT